MLLIPSTLTLPAAAQFFEVTPLVQGDHPAVFDTVYSVHVNAVNDLGQVVGYATFEYNNGTVEHAFVWDSTSGFTDLGDLEDGSAQSEAIDINNNGTIVGWSCVFEPGLGGREICQQRAFSVSPGGSMAELEADFVLQEEKEAIMTDVLREADWTRTQKDHVATSVNIHGQVVGYRLQQGIKVPNSIWRWFRFDGASMWNGTSHVALDGELSASQAYTVNDLGDVLGYRGEAQECPPSYHYNCIDNFGPAQTVLWEEGGGWIDLTIPGFRPRLEINNLRQIPGTLDDGTFALWHSETGPQPMPELPDDYRDLNDLGQVISDHHLWLPDSALGLPAGLHDLRPLILDADWDLLVTTHLSNTGSIVIRAEGPDVNNWPALLTPAQPNDIDPFAAVTLTSSNFPWSGEAGDPVNTLTGEFTRQPPPDLDLGGPLPLRFQRYYGSLLRRGRKIEGRLGDNWLHNFEWKLHRAEDVVVVVDWHGRVIQFEQEGAGWTLVRTPDTPFQLVETTDGFTLGDPKRARMYTFDAAGRLTKITDRNGNAHTLTYDEGLLTEVADGLGRTLTFTYDADDFLSAVSDGTRTVEFGYESNGSFKGLNDIQGVAEYVNYDPEMSRLDDGFQATQFLLVGVELAYDQQGRVAMQTVYGDEYAFTYGADGTTVRDPMGHTEQHEHDESGALASTSDPAGSRSLGSDDAGRRNSVTNRAGETTGISYHAPTGLVAAITYPDGTSLSHTFAAREQDGLTFYDKTQTTYPDGTTETYTYDDAGNVTAVTDRAGRTGTFTYNGRGQLLSATNPAGGTTSYTYNEDGTVASVTHPMGYTTTFGYDELRRPTLVTYADGSTIQRTYDDAGRLRTETDEQGNTTTYTYTQFDADVRRLTVTDPTGAETHYWYGYSFDDPLRATVDPTGAEMAFDYDDRGHLIGLTDPNGHETLFGYNDAGHLTSVTDAAGNAWARSYDAEGRLTGASNPLGATVQYTYDARGRPSRVTSPGGHTTQLSYDGMGRMTGLSGTGRSAAYTFDAMGRLTSLSTAGRETAVERNALGQITKVTGPAGNTWARTYNNAGALTSVTDPLGQATTYSYNERGWVSQVGLPDGPLSITYDPTGHVTEQSYSDGTTIDYTYDPNGRLVSATGVTLDRNARGEVIGTNGMVVARDDGGRVTSITLADGKAITYSYDARDLLTEVSDWTGESTALSYDAAGRLTTIERSNGVETSYTYDADNRVVGIAETKGEMLLAEHMLTRDASGNITGATRRVPQAPEMAPGTAAFTVRTGHQIEDFSYDAAGRRTQDDRRTYTWDAASRLTSYTEGDRTVAYTYDAFGNPRTRTADGSTRTYVHNYALGVPSASVVREDGVDLRYYVHTPDGRLLYRIAADSSRQFYHYDEMGNTLMLTDDAGAVVAAYAYTPYGQVVGKSGATADNPFTYLGKYGVIQEHEEGLYRMRRRLYDARTRRFITREPVAGLLHPQLINPYQYVAQNPLRYIDPHGASPSEPSSFEGSMLDQATDLASKASFPSTVAGVASNGMDLVKGSFKRGGSGEAGGLVKHFTNASNAYERNAFATYGVGNKPGGQRLLERSLDYEIRADKAKGVGRWAGRVGNAATLAGTANSLADAWGRIDRAGAEITGAQRASLSTLDRQLAELNRMADEKLITEQRKLELFESIMDAYQARQEAEFGTERVFGLFDVQRRNLGIYTESLIGLNNSARNLIPDPAGWTNTEYNYGY